MGVLHTERAGDHSPDPSANRQRLMATVASLFVPGVGQWMLGRRLRGAIWLAGFLALALIGAVHLVPGLVLMVVAAADTWWMGTPETAAPGPHVHTR